MSPHGIRGWILVVTLAFAPPIAARAQTVVVPADAGERWIDTHLDVKPGASIALVATGEISTGKGTAGPAGFPGIGSGSGGFPLESGARYGLVARLTSSRTNAHDDVREQWSYGERHDYCAQSGGHLWLTVNDNEPKDNKGAFTVTIKLQSCERDRPETRAPQLAAQGRFRVVMTGFLVRHQTRDDPLERDGAGDEVFTSQQSAIVDASAAVTNASVSSTLLMGDVHRGAYTLAGTAAGVQGGLRTGDAFPAPHSYEADHPVEVATGATYLRNVIPMDVFDGVLVQRANAAFIVASVWEWDNAGAELFDQYLRGMSGPGLARAVARTIADPAAQAPLVKSWRDLGLPLGITLGDGPLGFGEVNTRPIGMTRMLEDRYVFNPRALILTYDGALRAARAGTTIEVRYVDDPRLAGDYSIFFRVVEVLKPSEAP